MRMPKSLGLGWVPDLPDHRDHTFAAALADLKSNPAPDTPGLATGADGRHRTIDGWKAISRDCLEAYLGAKHQKQALDLLNVCKEVAFGKRNRQLLLKEPPAQPLERVDLRPLMSPIENQGPLGSCTTHAVIGLSEYLQIATRAAYVNASRRFLYKVTRDLLQWRGDQGAYIRETMKALRLFGACPERYCDYDLKLYDTEPGPFCYSFAANYQAVNYYRLQSLEDIKRTLTQGYPVAFGFTCYESLASRAAALTGVIPYPCEHEKVIGGHAVLAVGYYERQKHRKLNAENVEPDDQGYLIIRNSWGTGWGAGGYGYLPFSYVTGDEISSARLADDFWTMTQMNVPEWSDSSAAPFLLQRGRRVVEGGHPVTFHKGEPRIKCSPMRIFGSGSPLDEGDFGPWGGPVDGGGGGGVDYSEQDGGGPVDGGGGGAPTD
jgi:hypothetical protein